MPSQVTAHSKAKKETGMHKDMIEVSKSKGTIEITQERHGNAERGRETEREKRKKECTPDLFLEVGACIEFNGAS